MVESKLVELVVAGSNPVGHPTLALCCASAESIGGIETISSLQEEFDLLFSVLVFTETF